MLALSSPGDTGCGYNQKFGVAECCGVVVSFGAEKRATFIVTTKSLQGYYGIDSEGTNLRPVDRSDSTMKPFYTTTANALNAVSNTTYRNTYVYMDHRMGEPFDIDEAMGMMGAERYALNQTDAMITAFAKVYDEMDLAFSPVQYQMYAFRKV